MSGASLTNSPLRNLGPILLLLAAAGPARAQEQPALAPEPSPTLLCAEATESPGPSGRFWANKSFLFWWFKGSAAPPLLTTGTPTSGGILGRPGTDVLYGGGPIDQGPHLGGAFDAGYWFDRAQTIGVQAGFIYLENRSNHFATDSAHFPVLARPQVDAATGRESAGLVAFPGIATGGVAASLDTSLWGAQADLLTNLGCAGGCRVDLLGGFQYLNLKDVFVLQQATRFEPASAAVLGAEQVALLDRFAAHDQFYGGRIGAVGRLVRGPWTGVLQGTLALGDTHQMLDVGGRLGSVSPAAAVTTAREGLLAGAGNSGHFSRDVFAVVPALNLSVGRQITDHVAVFVGYSFLYWSDVLRATEQSDGGQSAAPLSGTDFWAHGLRVSLQARW